jgi:hypothetical protein
VFRRFALRARGGLRSRGGNTGVIFTHSYNKANQRAGGGTSDKTWWNDPTAATTVNDTANNLNQ